MRASLALPAGEPPPTRPVAPSRQRACLPSPRSGSPLDQRRALADLARLGALTLFAEMTLLRWVPTEMHIFGYMQNVVLLAILMGLGLGSLWAERKTFTPLFAGGLLALTVAIEDPLGLHLLPFKDIAHQLSPFQLDFDWFHAPSQVQWLGLRNVALVLLCLDLVTAIFVPLGQETARRMATSRDARDACAANLFGSLLGVGLFWMVCALHSSPVVWFGIVFLLALGNFDTPRERIVTALLLALVVLTTGLSLTDAEQQGLQGRGPSVQTWWSPYQRISVMPIDQRYGPGGRRELRMGYNVCANERQYQMMINLSPTWTRLNARLYNRRKLLTNPYDLPYRVATSPVRSVLILGAGAGNDAAAALRAGAARVVAVDIDPVILDLGRQMHPEDPYNDPRVECVADDARAWLERSNERFDLVVLAHVGSVNQDLSHSIRLDSYLYTRESLALIKRHLNAPHGMLACGISWVQPVLRKRVLALVHDAFGCSSWVFDDQNRGYQHGQSGLTCIGSWPAELARISKERPPQETGDLASDSRDADPASVPTDDWPYLFLPGRAVPIDTVLVSLGMALAGLVLVGSRLWSLRRSFIPGDADNLVSMFGLGAGFMLLEVHSTNRALLLLGATWHVQACILAAILVLLLIASRTTPRPGHFRAGWWWGGLLVSVAIQCALPLARLAALPWGARAVVGSLLLCLPVYFGSVLYVQLFESSRHREMALGLNLLGGFAGGLLETSSFALGLQAVSLLTLGVYALAGAASLWSASRVASASAEKIVELAAGHEGAPLLDAARSVEYEYGGNARDLVALR